MSESLLDFPWIAYNLFHKEGLLLLNVKIFKYSNNQMLWSYVPPNDCGFLFSLITTRYSYLIASQDRGNSDSLYISNYGYKFVDLFT